MISLIICSRTPDIDFILKENIKSTIGVNYELIVIDNSKNKYSIFSAYNEGVRRAKGDILCFMHEDVLFHTEDWGQKILNHFQDKSIGMIGLLGTHFLPSTPAYWIMSSLFTETMIQNNKGKRFSIEDNKLIKNEDDIIDAVACDGVILFIPQKLFSKIRFDDKTFSGFHFYDMDISMQVLNANYRVCIIKNVIIEHFQGGTYDKAFYKAQSLFFNKWKSNFPLQRGVELPDYMLKHLSNLIYLANDSRIARNSISYQLGNFLIQPYKILKGYFKR